MAIQSLSEFCAELGLPAECASMVIDELADRENQAVALHNARMGRAAGRPDNEALPLTDGGYEFGRVEARIPLTMAFNLAQRDGFGWEGLMSDAGMKDLLRDNPQCRVRTVGRIQSGWTPGRKVVKKYAWSGERGA